MVTFLLLRVIEVGVVAGLDVTFGVDVGLDLTLDVVASLSLDSFVGFV